MDIAKEITAARKELSDLRATFPPSTLGPDHMTLTELADQLGCTAADAQATLPKTTPWENDARGQPCISRETFASFLRARRFGGDAEATL